MMKFEFNKEEIKKEARLFEEGFNSVILGTISSEGEVDVTYAPFINYQNERYIFISEIGDHYSNLKNNNKQFEIMFLQDEKESISAVLRKRLRFNATAEFLPRNEKFEKVLDAFQEKIGEHIKLIRNMKDFHLVKLNILDGRFVKGFGQAYILKDGDILQMMGLRDRGHREE